MRMTATMQAALYNIKKRHHPQPQAYAFADVPDPALNAGVSISIIDRDYRVAVSDGTEWQWRETVETIS